MDKQTGVYKYMDCSTSHITEQESKYLETTKTLISYSNEYGFWVHVPEETPDIPENIKQVIEKARRLGCNWIKFDCDGEEHDDLKSFNW